MRIQWAWRSGISSYQVQAATSTAYSPVVKSVTLAGKSKRPSSGVMAVSVHGLQNATKYKFRVRAVSKGTPSAWSSTLSASTKVGWPSKIAAVSATSGPGAGEITFSWEQDGTYTTGYQLETALSLFSKTDKSLPTTGRNSRVFSIAPDRRTFTLSAEQVAEAGAGAGTGAHLLFRFYAVNQGTAGEQIRRYPYLQAIMPDAAESYTVDGDLRPGTSGLRVASFNVRSSKATGDSRTWLQRRADVADQITSRSPDIAALQELGPGRADGQAGTTTGTLRQTTSLLATLAERGGSQYKLIRTTPYVAPGLEHGSQGTRILYNDQKLTLLSTCSESTGSQNYSPSCSVELPLISGDSSSRRRTATYAQFRINRTGTSFWFVSAHLDERHSTSATTERTYNALRGRQMETVLAAVAEANTGGLPVVLGGDLNSWQNIVVGHAPHDTLVGAGFFDSASAPYRTNLKYSTYNGFATTQEASGVGFASRLDGIFVKGGTATSFENVTKVTDSTRPSDHNMVLANLVLGAR